MIYFLTINYYSTSLIAKLISSIQANQDFSQIVVVNNSPEDDTIRSLKNESVVLLEPAINLGFGQGCNLGLNWIYQQDSQAIVWLLNPDAYLLQSSLKKINLLFDDYPELSILGTAIYTPEGNVWFAGGEFIQRTGAILERDFLTYSAKNTTKEYVNCTWVSGCSLLINLRKFDECPQFDPAYFLYYEDFDFCKSYASLGHTVGITKQLSVVHQPSTITNRNQFNKYKHSTYSYLLTLDKYTNKLVLLIRLIRLLAHALFLLLVKPQIAFGKLYGVLLYLRRSLPSD